MAGRHGNEAGKEAPLEYLTADRFAKERFKKDDLA